MAPLLPRERRAHGRTPVIAGLSRALPPALQPQLASLACGYCHNIAEQASLSTWQIAPGQCLPATCAELLDETSTPPLVHPLLMVRGLWLVPDAGRISSSLMYQHGMRSRSLPPRLTVSRLPPTIVLGEVRRSARGWPTLPTSPRPLHTFCFILTAPWTQTFSFTRTRISHRGRIGAVYPSFATHSTARLGRKAAELPCQYSIWHAGSHSRVPTVHGVTGSQPSRAWGPWRPCLHASHSHGTGPLTSQS